MGTTAPVVVVVVVVGGGGTNVDTFAHDLIYIYIYRVFLDHDHTIDLDVCIHGFCRDIYSTYLGRSRSRRRIIHIIDSNHRLGS